MITTITSLEEMCDLMCDNRVPTRGKEMTNEEAQMILGEIHFHLMDSNQQIWDKDALSDAIVMAIEALSREQKKYDAICDELRELKSDLNLPIEVAMAYEKSIGVVRKYAKMGGSK